jgi:hypothetical protein
MRLPDDNVERMAWRGFCQRRARRRRSLGALAMAMSLMIVPGPTSAPDGEWSLPSAHAQTDRAAAQALFDQAVRLRDEGEFTAACAKFEESLRLDSGVGTRFNLADCMQRVGRYASAWSHFLEVVAATEMAGQNDRADVARKRAKKLEPRLTKLRLTPSSPAPGMTLRRNGVVVGQAQWDTPMPVDAGSYTIVATAPSKLPFEGSVVAQGEGQVIDFVVPALQDAPTPAPGVPGAAGPGGYGTGPRPGGDRGVSGTTIAGITLASVGVVGIGVGAAFGLIAMGKKSDVDELCPDATRCTVEGIAVNDEAKSAGNIATIGFIAGGALLTGGLVLWLAFPSESEQQATGRSSKGIAIRSSAAGHPGMSVVGRW